MENYLLEFMAVSRIRTARQRKRAVITAQDKQLLRMHYEYNALWASYTNRGYVQLDTPVLKGYVRFFVLRDDVARSKDAGFYQGMLDQINTRMYCAEKSFRVSKRYKR